MCADDSASGFSDLAPHRVHLINASQKAARGQAKAAPRAVQAGQSDLSVKRAQRVPPSAAVRAANIRLLHRCGVPLQTSDSDSLTPHAAFRPESPSAIRNAGNGVRSAAGPTCRSSRCSIRAAR